MDEQERLVAVIKGNFLAKYFPKIWEDQKNNKSKETAKLKEELKRKLKK